MVRGNNLKAYKHIFLDIKVLQRKVKELEEKVARHGDYLDYVTGGEEEVILNE